MATRTVIANTNLGRLLHKNKSCEDKSVQTDNDKIEFVQEEQSDQTSLNIRQTYKPINKGSRKLSLSDPRYFLQPLTTLPVPIVTLFDPSQLQYDWNTLRVAGPGFVNPHNTCFMNSILQVLSYTPPLWQYLVSDAPARTCKCIGFCSLCALSDVFKRMEKNKNSPILPSQLISNIRLIGSKMVTAQQEDAHEFLISLLSSFKNHFQHKLKGLDRYSKETQFIQHIFGGWIRSTITCDDCGYNSITFDPLFDINLDIERCNDIQSALRLFCSVEKIGGRQYKCFSCKNYVNAHKCIKIERLPRYLIVHLKRFYAENYRYYKNSKSIQTPETLDISECIAESNKSKISYSLQGIVVHRGSSCNSGHYIAYAKSRHDVWLRFNDSYVETVGIKTALSDEAYLLFYKLNHKENTQALTIDHSDRDIPKMKNHSRSNSYTAINNVSHQINTMKSSSTTEDINHFKDNKNGMRSSQVTEPKTQSNVQVAKWDARNQLDKIVWTETPNIEPASCLGSKVVSWNEGENHVDKRVKSAEAVRTKSGGNFDEYDRGKKSKKRRRASYLGTIFRQSPFQLIYNRNNIINKNKRPVGGYQSTHI